MGEIADDLSESDDKRLEGLQEKETAHSYELVAELYEEGRNKRKLTVFLLGLTAFFSFYSLIVVSVMVGKASSLIELTTYISDLEGSYEEITPSREKIINDEQAVEWVYKKSAEMLTINFKSYVEQVTGRKTDFTKEGWLLYVKSLEDNNVLDKVVQDGLMITAIPLAKPVMLKKYNSRGVTNWEFLIEVMQTVEGASDVRPSSKIVIFAVVEEVDRSIQLDGIRFRIFNVVE